MLSVWSWHSGWSVLAFGKRCQWPKGKSDTGVQCFPKKPLVESLVAGYGSGFVLVHKELNI